MSAHPKVSSVDGYRPRLLDPAKLRRRDSAAISSEWDVVAEAQSFLHLFRNGTESLAEIEWSIRMSDAELDELLREYPEERSVLERIQRRRAKTWNALLGMLTEHDRAMEQERKLKFPSSYAYLDIEEIR